MNPDYPSIEELEEALDTTIRFDRNNRLLVFFAMLSAYAHEPINVFMKGESSRGKTYLINECLKYFPEEDVHIYSTMSPKALFHGASDRHDDKARIDYIYWDGKILVLMDQPSDELLNNIKSLLSHDRWETRFCFTDKTSLKARTTVIKGWPAVLCCSTHFAVDDEVASRGFLLSPEDSDEKIEAAIELVTREHEDPGAYRRSILMDKHRNRVMSHILDVRDFALRHREEDELGNVKRLMIKKPYLRALEQTFKEVLEKLPPRFMRDWRRVIQLIDAIALWNFKARKYDKEEDLLISSPEDARIALRLFMPIMESIETGLAPNVLQFQRRVLQPVVEEKKREGGDVIIRPEELLEKYMEVYGRFLSRSTLNRYIKALMDRGILEEVSDPSDRRRRALRYENELSRFSNQRVGGVLTISNIIEIFDKKLREYEEAIKNGRPIEVSSDEEGKASILFGGEDGSKNFNNDMIPRGVCDLKILNKHPEGGEAPTGKPENTLEPEPKPDSGSDSELESEWEKSENYILKRQIEMEVEYKVMMPVKDIYEFIKSRRPGWTTDQMAEFLAGVEVYWIEVEAKDGPMQLAVSKDVYDSLIQGTLTDTRALLNRGEKPEKQGKEVNPDGGRIAASIEGAGTG